MRSLVPFRVTLAAFAAVSCVGLTACGPKSPAPVAGTVAVAPSPAPSPEGDTDAAMALFARNIAAIQARDQAAYLDCYSPTEGLVRAGGAGVKLGFAELAETTPATDDPSWPESLVAEDVEVHWLAPGVVYGAYKYTVTFDGETTTGLSERVFLNDGDRWTIHVSTAFEVAPGSDEAEGGEPDAAEHDAAGPDE
jgi:hypothetical protein